MEMNDIDLYEGSPKGRVIVRPFLTSLSAYARLAIASRKGQRLSVVIKRRQSVSILISAARLFFAFRTLSAYLFLRKYYNRRN